MNLNSNYSQSLNLIQTLSIILVIYCFCYTKGDKLVKCDFQKYPTVGCRNSDTQECDKKSQICKCGPKYPIKLLNGICLQHKAINQSCMGSVECNQIPNAGCFGLDTEFKDDFWILLWYRFGFKDPGKCDCDYGNNYEYNQDLKACIRKVIIGSRCATSWDCYNKFSNSICGQYQTCQCRDGYYYDSHSDSCKSQLYYDQSCTTAEGCGDSALECVKNVCKCKPGFHYDKYKSNKCEPNEGPDCSDSEGLADCLKRSIQMMKMDSKRNKFDLIEPPRIYSIFVILAFWICLLFILGNAKRGLRLMELAIRRDQASQYIQCDTYVAQEMIESEDQELGSSQLSLQSDMSAAINQSYPPPAFDELFPNDCHQTYSDDPPPYEEVVQLDKHKNFVV